MNHTADFHHSKALERALALLAAVGVTAGIGLAAYDVSPDANSRALPTDANEQRSAGTPAPVRPAALPQGTGALDPALRTIDQAGAHHG